MPDASAGLTYVDTSAVIKLLFAEAESDALRAWLSATSPSLVSSALLEVELARTVVRARNQARSPVPDTAVQAVLASIDLIDLDAHLLHAASALPDPYLRTLDAIHIAAALSVDGGVTAVLTYDVRMTQAADARSIAVAAPR